MAGPLDFPPHDICRFKHRFDDPKKSFRTVYSSAKPVTCFKEVLAPLRPDQSAVEAFARFGGISAPRVDLSWRKEHVLALARIHLLRGRLVRLNEDEETLRQLLDPGLRDLNANAIRQSGRDVTQQIARCLFDQGCAGLVYESKFDPGGHCIALFEGRARLEPAEELPRPRPLTEPVEELLQVCEEWGLLLEPGAD